MAGPSSTAELYLSAGDAPGEFYGFESSIPQPEALYFLEMTRQREMSGSCRSSTLFYMRIGCCWASCPAYKTPQLLCTSPPISR